MYYFVPLWPSTWQIELIKEKTYLAAWIQEDFNISQQKGQSSGVQKHMVKEASSRDFLYHGQLRIRANRQDCLKSIPLIHNHKSSPNSYVPKKSS